METIYLVVDRHTARVVGRCKTLAAARRSVDRRDNAYGAYRYFVERATYCDAIARMRQAS